MTDEPTAPEAYDRVPLDDWAGIEERLRRVAGPGAVTVSGGEIRLASGSATFTVTREGEIDAGMPLHGFAKGGVDALYVDADRGRIRVYGPGGLAYEFRVP